MDGRAWSPRSSRVNPPGNVPFGAPTSSLGGGRREGGEREGGKDRGREGGEEGEQGEQGEMYIYTYATNYTILLVDIYKS